MKYLCVAQFVNHGVFLLPLQADSQIFIQLKQWLGWNIIIYSRRDKDGKIKLPISNSASSLNTILDDIQNSLFTQAKQFQNENTHTASNYSDFKSIIDKGGFVICGWDGTHSTEEVIKKETKATIRCIPFNQDIDNLKCIYSGNAAQYKVIFSKAY